MKIQLWTADYVPEDIPEWVNPAITVDYNRYGRRYFIFEIDPDDEIFCRCKAPDNKAAKILKLFGFIKPKKIYQGLASEMYLSPSDEPPMLSELTIAKL